MKTRIQKLLVGVVLVAATTLAQAQFTYTNTGNGTCTITGYTGPGGAVTIPNSVNGLVVVSIGSYSFYSNTSLTNVTIPASVTSIGNAAFTVCTHLTSVTIPGNVTSIGGFAFDYCSSLTDVTIPGSVTNIGSEAFADCSYLTAISVDPANSFYSSANGVLFDKNRFTLIQCPGSNIGVIPGGVASIGDYAFVGCNLNRVTLPESVTSIGRGAFSYCKWLTSVAIGNGVTSISDDTFLGCSSLTSVTIPASVSRIGVGAFGGCFSLTAAYFLGNAPLYSGDVFDDGAGGLLDPVIVHYLPGAIGWDPFFCFVPTEMWNPQASALRVTGGHFGFDITGPSNTIIVVEACTNLAQPGWLPVSTNTLNGSGASSFSDSESGNYHARFYRFRSP